ncbi:MAG TPA: phosphatase PAP2 family protein [Actinomycetes bacterium]|nr:phosphatase PAP2 family protein [Actinomycetes bacterium]
MTAGRAATWGLPAGYARHPADVVSLVVGSGVVALTTLAIHANRVGTREADLFRVVNDLALPGWTYPAVWLVMQLGVIGAVPLVAALAVATRRLRLALDALLAAGSIYMIAKLIKEFVQRGRPRTLLEGVHVLGEPARGLGYVSGHSAVAVALATVAGPYLGRTARRVAWTLAVLVCLARMYVGAHLPFDVLGGAALGLSAGALVHLALGAPVPRVPPGAVRRALEARGFDPAGLRPLGPGRRSARFVTGDDGPGLFVKAVVAEWRDRDLLYRGWRRLRAPTARTRRQGPSLHEVEHEAAMALLAAAAGVRTPRVLLAGAYGRGAALLVQQRIHGRTLAEPGAAGQVGGALADEVRRQVGLLHAAGIAHGDLEPANVVVDGEGRPWLVDFDQAAVADGPLIARDESALSATLGRLAGPDRDRDRSAARAERGDGAPSGAPGTGQPR